MRNESITALFRSFEKLERALEAAEDASSKDQALQERLQSYRESLIKQKDLARALAEQVAEGNFSQVRRNIDLIREHSSMIRDDARSVLGQRQVVIKDQPQAGSYLH